MKKFFKFLLVVVIIGAVIFGVVTLIKKNSAPKVYYDVSFNLSEYTEGVPPSLQKVESGKNAATPASPDRTGYEVVGWYLNSDLTGTAWNFNSDAITSNVTLYAKWDLKSYSVSFDTNGSLSAAPEAQSVKYLNKAAAPLTPSKTGYDFLGWYTDDAGGVQWDFADNTIAQNTVLYAHWNLSHYTVLFNLAGGTGTLPSFQSVTYLDKVTAPSGTYAKSGYTFAGWWLGVSPDNYTQEWNFDSDVPLKSMTLYAGWGTSVIQGDYSFIELDNCVKITDYVPASSDIDGNVKIPDSLNLKPVLSIGAGAFQSFSDDTANFVLPSGLTTICTSAFQSCTAIVNLVIPDSVTSIGKTAFNGCKNMMTLKIGSGVKDIGEQAFCQCTSLYGTAAGSLVIPSNVIILQNKAFNVSSATGALYTVTLNEGLEIIGTEAFENTDILKIDVPNTVTSIGVRAFAFCNYLTRIETGTGIKSIGYEAFKYANSDHLYVIVHATVPPTIDGAVFDTVDPSVTLKRLFITLDSSALIDVYKAFGDWKTYYSDVITRYSMDSIIVYPTNRP